MTTVSSDWNVVAFPEEGPPVRRDTPPPLKEWETLCGRFVQIPGPSESGAATLTSQRFDLGGILANWERICNFRGAALASGNPSTARALCVRSSDCSPPSAHEERSALNFLSPANQWGNRGTKPRRR